MQLVGDILPHVLLMICISFVKQRLSNKFRKIDLDPTNKRAIIFTYCVLALMSNQQFEKRFLKKKGLDALRLMKTIMQVIANNIYTESFNSIVTDSILLN